MENETLLRALQEGMRKLTENGIAFTSGITQLREKAEQAQLAIDEVTEEQSAAVQEHERVAKEAKVLRDHISGLVRNRADSILISTLEDELKDLDKMEREANQQVEALKMRVRGLNDSLNALKAELEAREVAHRRLSDQAMTLRTHIEKVAHT